MEEKLLIFWFSRVTNTQCPQQKTEEASQAGSSEHKKKLSKQ